MDAPQETHVSSYMPPESLADGNSVINTDFEQLSKTLETKCWGPRVPLR